MGRRATKAVGNRFYEARMEAALYNERLSSRAGAAEVLGVSEDVVKDAELGLHKCIPVDLVMLMADAYNAPDLMNYFCLSECPIGKDREISDKMYTIDRVTVRLLKSLKLSQLEQVKDRLLDIAEDGIVSVNEIEDLREILVYLGTISRTISELKLIGEKITGGR